MIDISDTLLSRHWLQRVATSAIPRAAMAVVMTVAVTACQAKSGAQNEGASKKVPAAETAEADTTGKSHEETVTLTEVAMRTAGIATQEVRASESVNAEALDVPGQVDFDPRRVALISPKISGRMEKILVAEGDRVRAGQPVALLQSPAFLNAQSDYIQALRRVNALRNTPDAAGADAIADAAKRRLRLMGVDDATIARLASEPTPKLDLPIVAPFSGSIIEEHMLPGAAIEAGASIFKLADLSVVDVIAEVPERLIPYVHVGLGATVTIGAYPELHFTGEVERLRDVLNAETRTIRAVIHVPNNAYRLRPGMFANVRLHARAPSAHALSVTSSTTSSQAKVRNDSAMFSIPESAIVSDGSNYYVFVETAPRTYLRRLVHTRAPLAAPGISPNDSTRRAQVVVTSGIAAGERVVVAGAFVLKSELAKSAFAEED